MFSNSPLTQKFGFETEQLPVEQGRALPHISQRVSLNSSPKGLYIFDLHLEFDLVVHVPEGLHSGSMENSQECMCAHCMNYS